MCLSKKKKSFLQCNRVNKQVWGGFSLSQLQMICSGHVYKENFKFVSSKCQSQTTLGGGQKAKVSSLIRLTAHSATLSSNTGSFTLQIKFGSVKSLSVSVFYQPANSLLSSSFPRTGSLIGSLAMLITSGRYAGKQTCSIMSTWVIKHLYHQLQASH